MFVHLSKITKLSSTIKKFERTLHCQVVNCPIWQKPIVKLIFFVEPLAYCPFWKTIRSVTFILGTFFKRHLRSDTKFSHYSTLNLWLISSSLDRMWRNMWLHLEMVDFYVSGIETNDWWCVLCSTIGRLWVVRVWLKLARRDWKWALFDNEISRFVLEALHLSWNREYLVTKCCSSKDSF